MKKVYVAARAKYRTKDAENILTNLKNFGFDVAYDWPAGNDAILKPYRDPKNRKHNLSAQEQMLKAAAEADIFILLDEPGLRGAYVELGAFLFKCIENQKEKAAYIVGAGSEARQHIFESPEYVHFFDTIDEVYEDLKARD